MVTLTLPIQSLLKYNTICNYKYLINKKNVLTINYHRDHNELNIQ